MSDWIFSDGRDIYRHPDGHLIDLTNAPPEMVADMVRARREARQQAENNKLKQKEYEDEYRND